VHWQDAKELEREGKAIDALSVHYSGACTISAVECEKSELEVWAICRMQLVPKQDGREGAAAPAILRGRLTQKSGGADGADKIG
jgi:hypothetical protein